MLFGGSALNVLRGPAQFASVVSGKAMKSCYDPALSRCNFPVPDVINLRKIKTGYPKITEAGILQFTLDVCEKQALLGTQFCISFDGMHVSQGCKGISHGDINLWVREEPRSIEEACCILDMDLTASKEINIDVSDTNTEVVSFKLKILML